jgi:hypothetical protein
VSVILTGSGKGQLTMINVIKIYCYAWLFYHHPLLLQFSFCLWLAVVFIGGCSFYGFFHHLAWKAKGLLP